MWNSNSLISWLIARSGLDAASIQPPAGGRAPGWQAGIVMAQRQQVQAVSGDSLPRHLQQGLPASLVLERKLLQGIERRAEHLVTQEKEESRA